MRILERVALILLVALSVAAVAFTVWAYTPLGPMPEALAALQSDARVAVDTSQWITFMPVGQTPDTGFIIYPGGRVDPSSYAPTARAIAEAGYLVVIVPMPFNLAVFGSSRAQKVIDAHPEVSAWAVGGHSLGGAMAAAYLYGDGEIPTGLVLWAAYPAGNDDLSTRDLHVASIFGTLDGVATVDEVASSRALLPPEARFLPIEGGNHAQFGWYGPQRGDNDATISREQQQAQVVKGTLELLDSLAGS